MSELSQAAKLAIQDLVVANRILGDEGVVDAYGHVSVRNPDNRSDFFVALGEVRNSSPKTISWSMIWIATRSIRTAE